MSTFVIVPGAWDTPAAMEPVLEPLKSAGHDVIVVDLPCGNANASLAEYADAVRGVLPDDLTEVVLVGEGFAAFDGVILSAGPGLCALNIDLYVAAADPSEQDLVRTYLERTQRPQGIAALREKWSGDLPASRRRNYILTTAETLVPPKAQRVMASSVGAAVVEIDTDHEIFREQPVLLAELLVAAIR